MAVGESVFGATVGGVSEVAEKGGKSLITVSSEVAVGMAAVQSSIEATAQLQQNADKLEKLGKKTK